MKIKKINILIFFFYAAVTATLFWGLLKNIGHVLAPGDGLFTYWIISWDVHSALHNPLDLFNANIFYPNQNTVAYSEGLFAPALLALPLFLILGNMLAAYNLILIFSYILAAFGAFKLAEYYTKNRYAAFVAGIIFGFATFRIASGHYQNLMIFWMPFAALYLQKYLDTRRRKFAVYFALLFSAQMLSCWNMGAFFAFFTVFLLAANHKTIRQNFQPILKDAALVLAIVAALVGPFAYPSIKLHWQTHFSWTLQDMINGSADIGGYVIPLPGSFESVATTFLRITKSHWVENWNFLGYFSILLLGWYLLFGRRKIEDKNFKIYAWGIPLFIILSFGPIARFIPSMRIPLPYYLLVPVTGFIRTPSRLAIIVLLCLSVAVAYVVSFIKIKNARLKLILGVLAPVVILAEFYLPGNPFSYQAVCPPIYLDIKNDPSVTAMAEMPVYAGMEADSNVDYLFYSTCDDFRPIFNGYSGYFPPKYGKDAKAINSFPDQASLDKLSGLKISHVLLHLDRYPKDQQEPLLQAVGESNLQIVRQSGQDYLIKVPGK